MLQHVSEFLYFIEEFQIKEVTRNMFWSTASIVMAYYGKQLLFNASYSPLTIM